MLLLSQFLGRWGLRHVRHGKLVSASGRKALGVATHHLQSLGKLHVILLAKPSHGNLQAEHFCHT